MVLYGFITYFKSVVLACRKHHISCIHSQVRYFRASLSVPLITSVRVDAYLSHSIKLFFLLWKMINFVGI